MHECAPFVLERGLSQTGLMMNGSNTSTSKAPLLQLLRQVNDSTADRPKAIGQGIVRLATLAAAAHRFEAAECHKSTASECDE